MLSCTSSSNDTTIPPPGPGFGLISILIASGPPASPTPTPTPVGSTTATPRKTPTITPRPAATPTTIGTGVQIQFDAQGTFLKGKSDIRIDDITVSPGTLWSSSDSTVLIPPSTSANGGIYISGVVPGCACINASSSGITSPPVSIGVVTDVNTCPACPAAFAVAGASAAQQSMQEDSSPPPQIAQGQVAQNAGVLMWTFNSGSQLTGRMVTGPDSSVYFITRDNVLHGLDSNGKQFMRQQAFGASPAVMADGKVAAMTSESELSAIASDGTSAWHADIGAGAGPLCASASAIYAAAGGDLVSVSTLGAINWRVSVGSVSVATTTADGVVVAAKHGSVTALGSDGAVAWTFTPDGGFSGSLASAGDAFYVGSAGGILYAVDSRTGRELWREASPQAIVAGPAVSESGIVSFGADILYGVSSDGQLRWTQPGVKIAADSSAPVVLAVGSDNVFGTGADELGAMLIGDGAFAWTSRSFGEIAATAATPTGMLYVGNSKGRVFAVR